MVVLIIVGVVVAVVEADPGSGSGGMELVDGRLCSLVVVCRGVVVAGTNGAQRWGGGGGESVLAAMLLQI